MNFLRRNVPSHTKTLSSDWPVRCRRADPRRNATKTLPDEKYLTRDRFIDLLLTI